MIKKLKKKWNSMDSDDRIILVGMVCIEAIIGTAIVVNLIIENKFIKQDGTETVIK